MPQFRQDFVTKDWVIVAPERAKRPDQFHTTTSRPPLAAYDPGCPFCPGNEDKTPTAVMTKIVGDTWNIRVVPNKFAAVNPDLSPLRHEEGRYLTVDGFGVAEVVIETPRHDGDITRMSTDEVRELLLTYSGRYSAIAQNEHIDLITIFRNHGVKAGTSLAHPHSQIIATPIVPGIMRNRLIQAQRYHDAHGDCPYCVMLAEELSQQTRIVAEGRHFVVLCPYASRSPFETRIIPKRHCSSFDHVSADELSELAILLQETLLRFRNGLSDPDYNLLIHSSPTSDGEVHYDHWRLLIIPRLTTPAGFELGSGIFINIQPPEECAAFLRSVSPIG